MSVNYINDIFVAVFVWVSFVACSIGFHCRPNFYNSTSPPAGQFQGGPQFGSSPEDMQAGNMMSSPPNSSHSSHPGSIGSPPLPFTGPGMPQNPPGPPPPQGFGQCSLMPPPGQPPAFHGNMQHMNRPPLNQQGAPFQPMPDMQMNMPFQNMGKMPSEFFKNLFSSQSLAQGGRSLFSIN